MPRSLSARLGAAFALLALAIVLAVGATTFVALRDLEGSAQVTSLEDLSRALLPQARAQALQGNLRAALKDLDDVLAEKDVTAYLLAADGRLHGLEGGQGIDTPAAIQSSTGGSRGTGDGGIDTFPDGVRYAWASTVLRPPGSGGSGARAVLFVSRDVSGAAAVQDLIRVVPFVAIVTIVIGALLGWLIVRSLSGPLRRLARATSGVASANAEPIPVEGPTEVRELIERFNAMSLDLADSRRRENELLANLRHDIRTPLTVIGGFASALADGTATGPDAERAARAIVEETDRLERLVDELGAVERLGDDGHGLRPEEIDARQMLRLTADRFAAQAEAHGATLDVIDPPGSPARLSFAGDRLAVERILANLVENALLAVGDGPGHIWLTADATDRGPGDQQSVVLSVTDDGPGFPPGTMNRAFERFYRVDPARQGPGSGLGLSIVRELARSHGGEAFAENVAPHGARVSVALPLVPRPAFGAAV